jgi:hypothetical protein
VECTGCGLQPLEKLFLLQSVLADDGCQRPERYFAKVGHDDDPGFIPDGALELDVAAFLRNQHKSSFRQNLDYLTR